VTTEPDDQDQGHEADDGGLFGLGRPDIVAVDQAGAQMLVGTAHVLAGLLAAELLHYAGSPEGLLGVLFPDAEGEARDRLMFTAGAVVGAGAGLRKGRSRWDPAWLEETAAQLYEAGFEAMGRLAERAAAVAGHGAGDAESEPTPGEYER
jgi:hypothetical protein